MMIHTHRTPTSIGLLLLFLALVPVTAQEASDPAALAAAFNEALASGDWQAAVTAGERLAELEASDAILRYNLACAYALSGRSEEAMASLQQSADLGFDLLSTLDSDADLDSIRGYSGFAAARARVERNAAAAREEFEHLSESARVLTVLPRGVAPKKPAALIVAMHGFGGDADGFAPVYEQAAADRGAVLIAPEAVRPSGRGYTWGELDEAEQLVLDAVERARAAYPIDPSRIVLTGFSQGGYLTYALALRHPDLFAGAIPVAGSYFPRQSPVPEGAERLPRFFIMYGGRDSAVANNREAAKILREAGAKVELKIYPEIGHAYPLDRDRELRRALDFVLGG